MAGRFRKFVARVFGVTPADGQPKPPTPPPAPMIVVQPRSSGCDECHGTGRCEECQGTGKHFEGMYKGQVCRDCRGDLRCWKCDGTGRPR